MPAPTEAHRGAPGGRGRFALLLVVALAVLAAACGDGAVSDERLRCTPLATESGVISIDPPWRTGEQRVYEIVSRIDYGGGLAAGLPDPSWAWLRVGAATDDGFEMAWDAVPPDVALTVSQFDGVALTPTSAHYEWGAAGDEPHVTNPFELGLWLGDAIDSTRLGLPAVQSASFDQNVAHYETMSGNQLDHVFLAPATVLHSLEGIEVEVDEVLDVQRSFANGLTDVPLQIQSTVEIVELVDSSGCVTLRITGAPDVAEFATLMADAAGTDEAVSGTFELEQVLVAQYDAGSGYIKSVTITDTVKGGGINVTETTTILDITGAGRQG